MKAMIHLRIFGLELFAVLGRYYSATSDTYQRSCFRLAWRGQPFFRIGARPEPA